MATARYLHISFNFEGKPPANKVLEDVFNSALDWYRYAPNCWILYTTTEAVEWSERCRKVLPATNSILVIEFDLSNKTGYLQKSVWEWLHKDRNKS